MPPSESANPITLVSLNSIQLKYKDCKIITMNMFKNLKEYMNKSLNEVCAKYKQLNEMRKKVQEMKEETESLKKTQKFAIHVHISV